METSKQQFLKDYSTPLDCRIYNYSPQDMLTIARLVDYSFPEPHRNEKQANDRQYACRWQGLLLAGGGATAFSLLSKNLYAWGRLTSGKRVHFLAGYAVLTQVLNYFVLDHASKEVDLMLKYSSSYADAIRLFEAA
jgi:hypothetical protein